MGRVAPISIDVSRTHPMLILLVLKLCLTSSFLEYVPGGSVASVYRRHKKFEEQVIKSFTKQILEGLQYLHSLHILHRVSRRHIASPVDDADLLYLSGFESR